MGRIRLLLLAVSVLCLTGCGSLIKQGTRFLEEGELSKAKESFQKSVDKEKNLSEAYFGLGMIAYEEEEYDAAITYFGQVSELEEVSSQIVLAHLLGVCCMHCEEYEQALEAFAQGISLATSGEAGEQTEEEMQEMLQEMRFNQVVCYEKLYDWAGAKEAAQDYLELYPDDADMTKELEFLAGR